MANQGDVTRGNVGRSWLAGCGIIALLSSLTVSGCTNRSKAASPTATTSTPLADAKGHVSPLAASSLVLRQSDLPPGWTFVKPADWKPNIVPDDKLRGAEILDGHMMEVYGPPPTTVVVSTEVLVCTTPATASAFEDDALRQILADPAPQVNELSAPSLGKQPRLVAFKVDGTPFLQLHWREGRVVPTLTLIDVDGPSAEPMLLAFAKKLDAHILDSLHRASEAA